MANIQYAKGKEAILKDGLDGRTLKFVLVDTELYTVNANTHQFLTDIPAGARVTTTPQLSGVTFTNGVLKFTNPTLPDVGGGVTGEALVMIDDTGDPATSPLFFYLDTAEGLPITEDSTADSIQLDPAGLYAL